MVLKNGRSTAVERDVFLDQNALNQSEVYMAHIGSQNYGFFLREGNVSILFAFDLIDEATKPARFVGRISGWVEAGASKVPFSLRHPDSGLSTVSHAPAVLAATRDLLQTSGTKEIYDAAVSRCEARKTKMRDRLAEVDEAEKKKVNRALDDLL
jgi:hypothetical protein